MDIREILITIVVGVVGAAISFYIKDFLMQKLEYRKLRRKLERVAGKNAAVIYGDDEVFTIQEIDESGVTLKNELKTIFIPTAKLLQSEMVLPSADYVKVVERRKQEERLEMTKLLIEEFMGSAIPSMLGPMREDSKETREALLQVLSKLESEGKKDSTKELLNVLIRAGVLEPPDPVQVMALRFAQLLQGGVPTEEQATETD